MITAEQAKNMAMEAMTTVAHIEIEQAIRYAARSGNTNVNYVYIRSPSIVEFFEKLGFRFESTGEENEYNIYWE